MISLGRTPKPHMIRAWALPMRAMSQWLIPKAVGRPVVPGYPMEALDVFNGTTTVTAEGRVVGLIPSDLLLKIGRGPF